MDCAVAAIAKLFGTCMIVYRQHQITKIAKNIISCGEKEFNR